MADQQPVAAGRRATYVRLDRGTPGVGRSTRPTMTWTPLDHAWAHKVDVSGSERFRVAQVEADFDTLFTLAYRADMDPERIDVPTLRRVVYQDRIFEIVFAKQIGRRRGIELAARAGSRIDPDEHTA